jgi:hypothetical protein
MEYSCFVTVRLQLSLKYRPTPIVSKTNANKNELTPARPVPSTGSNTRLLSSLSLTRLARRSDPDGAKPRTGEWWRRALGEPRAGVRHWTTLMLGARWACAATGLDYHGFCGIGHRSTPATREPFSRTSAGA